MSIRDFCDVMALIRKGQRTPAELVQITGLSRSTIESYIDALHGEGHVRIVDYREGGRGQPPPVYAWQDVPHLTPDVKRTEPATK